MLFVFVGGRTNFYLNTYLYKGIYTKNWVERVSNLVYTVFQYY